MPLLPPVWVVVFSWIGWVIHESSPVSATTVSAGFSTISRTGNTVPLTCESITRSFLRPWTRPNGMGIGT